MRVIRRLQPVLLLGLLLAAWPARAARAEEPWETQARQEIEEETRLLDTARRRGTTRQVVGTYASRLDRQPSALNHFLLGRALYYDGDPKEAERHLREALRLEPRFWFARLRLAILENERGQGPAAEEDLAAVLAASPREPEALKLLADVKSKAKDWDGALRALEGLLAANPGDLEIRYHIAVLRMQKQDWTGALSELRLLRGRQPDDPRVRWLYACAAQLTGDLKEAVHEFESLARLQPKDLGPAEHLVAAYYALHDWKGLQSALDRALPLLPKDDPRRAAWEDFLRRLQAGERPGEPAPATPDDETWQRDPFAELVERCQDASDASRRRAALQEYYDAKIPMVPAALVRRVIPEIEPDPTCRKWLLRIMGRLENPALAQIVARGLLDPDVDVRVLAAETLGEIKTPSGVIYLLGYFLGPKLGDPPDAGQTKEMNAARAALIGITGRLDERGGPDVWVAAPDVAAMRAAWQVWLAAPDGIHQRLKGILDLDTQGEEYPEIYLIEDAMDTSPDIARAAYRVMRHRAEREGPEAPATSIWAKFPRIADDDLAKDDTLPRMRGAVKTWWDAWVKALRDARTGGGG